ncbi:unnamed protein product, partial [Rotaria sp. Silwood1]
WLMRRTNIIHINNGIDSESSRG